MIVGGVLSPLENVLTDVLTWLHDTGGLSWAWSIVALTVIVRMLLVPVAIRQIHSMQSLQIHAPEMKAIQQRYKADRQKQSEELMKFYKENKINPYASCLPIVFQIPIFISLFFVLKDFEKEIFSGVLGLGARVARPRGHHGAREGRLGAGAHRRLRREPAHVDVPHVDLDAEQGAALHDHGPADRVPPFILSFPSGLMIYWLTTNLWTTGQGIVTRRQMPRPVVPPKRSSRTPPKEEPDGSSNGEPPSAGRRADALARAVRRGA